MARSLFLIGVALLVTSPPLAPGGGKQKDDAGITVDKDKRLLKIDAKIAPRKLEHLKEIYPLEVVACWPHPKGKKAHETLVIIDAKPSAVHKALVDFGVKPGTPIMGQSKEKPQGPEVKLWLEFPGDGGETKKVSIDRTMVDKANKALAVNWDDELVKATALTRDGAVIHPDFQPK